MSSAGTDVVVLQADASNAGDTQHVIDTTIQRFGRLDILVNNAAVFYRCLAAEMTEDSGHRQTSKAHSSPPARPQRRWPAAAAAGSSFEGRDVLPAERRRHPGRGRQHQAKAGGLYADAAQLQRPPSTPSTPAPWSTPSCRVPP